MKRPFSPVVWLCAALAVALSVLPVIDPTGIYAGYTAALAPETPRIAAVFTAAQDGVYPWSTFASPGDIPYSPAYRPLTGTVTDEEMRSSVGNDEPFSETVPDAVAVDAVTPSVEVVPAGSGEAEPDGGEARNVPDTFTDGGEFVPVDASWFDDAVFIGDSHTEGFCDYAGLHNATYYYKRGLDIWSVLKKPFVSGKLTIPQALAAHRFGKIYIMLGINEIGCGTTESFAAQYADVVAQLRELQPDALIYIQAIFHTSQKKSDTTQYNNERINARNAAISQIADGKHVFFIDCNVVFDDANGALTPAYSGDGVHVKAPYYTMWRDYLMLFGRSGVAAVEDERAPIPSSSTEPDSSVPTPAAKPGAIPETEAVPTAQSDVGPVVPPSLSEPTPAQPVEADAAPASETLPASNAEPEGVSDDAAANAAAESQPDAEEEAQEDAEDADTAADAEAESTAEMAPADAEAGPDE